MASLDRNAGFLLPVAGEFLTMIMQRDLFDKKTIQERFESFLDKYPFIWELFKAQVFRARRHGFDRVGSKAIVEYLRWNARFERLAGEDFKIDNVYTSRFARKFKEEYPGYPIEFETRTLKTE